MHLTRFLEINIDEYWTLINTHTYEHTQWGHKNYQLVVTFVITILLTYAYCKLTVVSWVKYTEKKKWMSILALVYTIKCVNTN